MTMVLISTLFTMMLMLMKNMMKMYNKNKLNKNPFECGFSKMQTEIPFSIQFFILSTMFIVFDIEITILITMIKPMKMWSILNWGPASFMFLMALIMGIVYEWKESAMYWTK